MSCEEGDRQIWIWQLADAAGLSPEASKQALLASSIAYGQGIADTSQSSLAEQQQHQDDSRLLNYVMAQDGLYLLRPSHTQADGLPGLQAQRGYSNMLRHALENNLLAAQRLRSISASANAPQRLRTAARSALARHLLRTARKDAAQTDVAHDPTRLTLDRLDQAQQELQLQMHSNPTHAQVRLSYRYDAATTGVALLYKCERHEGMGHGDAARYAYNTAKTMGSTPLEAETIALWCHMTEGGEQKYAPLQHGAGKHPIDIPLAELVSHSEPRSAALWQASASHAQTVIEQVQSNDGSYYTALDAAAAQFEWNKADKDLLLRHAANAIRGRPAVAQWEAPENVAARPSRFTDEQSRDQFDGSGSVRWKKGAQAIASKAVGTPISSADILDLIGAPSDARVDVYPQALGIICTVQHPLYEFNSIHMLGRQESGQWELSTQVIELKNDAPHGTGTRIIAHQREAAMRMGFAALTLYAAKSEGMNGYYTWPRMGFDLELRPENPLPKHMAHCTTSNELMQIPDGAAWWRSNGHGGEAIMAFDNETSTNVWERYAQSKGITNRD